MTNDSQKKPPPPAPPRPSDRADEARDHNRLPFEIELNIVSEHNFYAGLSLNISEGGLFVSTHVSYPVGTKLEIRMLFPGDEEPTALMTEVRWSRPHSEIKDAAPGGMGLRFVDIPAPIADKIRRFTKNREPMYYEDD